MCAVSRLSELRKVDNGKLVVSITFPVFLAQHVGKEGDKLLLILYQLVCVLKVPTGTVVDSVIGIQHNSADT